MAQSVLCSARLARRWRWLWQGCIGRGAERVRDTRPLDEATVLGLPAGRMLAAVTAAGLAGTVG